MSAPPLPCQLAALLAELVELVAHRIVELQTLGGQSEPVATPSPWLSLDSAAEYLDWPRQRLYKLTARGAIPHYKQEGRLAFRRDELERWLERYAQGEREWMRTKERS